MICFIVKHYTETVEDIFDRDAGSLGSLSFYGYVCSWMSPKFGFDFHLSYSVYA